MTTVEFAFATIVISKNSLTLFNDNMQIAEVDISAFLYVAKIAMADSVKKVAHKTGTTTIAIETSNMIDVRIYVGKSGYFHLIVTRQQMENLRNTVLDIHLHHILLNEK